VLARKLEATYFCVGVCGLVDYKQRVDIVRVTETTLSGEQIDSVISDSSSNLAVRTCSGEDCGDDGNSTEKFSVPSEGEYGAEFVSRGCPSTASGDDDSADSVFSAATALKRGRRFRGVMVGRWDAL